MTCRLEHYTAEELVKIVTRSAVLIDVSIDASAAAEIAACSRGTPRIANNLLRLDGPRLGLTSAIRRSAWREVQLILTKELWALAEARPDFEELPDWIVHIEAASVAVEQGRAILVFRYLVWVIAKLTDVWDGQIELTGAMVGYSSEVDEVFKSARHSFC
jgi:hypothetical protein